MRLLLAPTARLDITTTSQGKRGGGGGTSRSAQPCCCEALGIMRRKCYASPESNKEVRTAACGKPGLNDS